jgi:hypothetical protein
LKNKHFPGIGEIREVQQGKKLCFNSKKGHSNAKETSYRKVSAYTKSMNKYGRERERRRHVRLLVEKGHTQKAVFLQKGIVLLSMI